MATSIPPSKKKQPVKPAAKKKAVNKPNFKTSTVTYEYRPFEVIEEKDREINELKERLSLTEIKYEAVKERLSELNKPQPDQEEKKQCAEQSRELTRSERILARFGEELNHFNHVSDLIDGKIEAISGESTQKGEFANDVTPSFLEQLDVCICRFEVANKRNLLMFDHLCKII